MRELTIAGYLLCVLIAGALALMSQTRDPLLASPGEMLDEFLATRAPRVALVAFWWWLGWHFLVVRTVDPALG